MPAPTPFLTDLDSRAAVRGSVDPLGIEVIWIRLGRHVVGNLTTVSNSVRDFITLVLGHHFIEQMAETTQDQRAVDIFIRWEQLAAYARGQINSDWTFRGSERAKRNLGEDTVRISADLSSQILASQKTYGVWGIYSVASRTSGLIEGDPARLTAPARELVDGVYLPAMERAHLDPADVERRLKQPSSTLSTNRESDLRLLRGIAAIWSKRPSSRERELLRDHLLWGGPTDRTRGVQRAIAEAMSVTLDDATWELDVSQALSLAKLASKLGEPGQRAADCLERIIAAEQLLAPAAALFDTLLASDGQTLDEVAKGVGALWGRAVGTIDTAAIEKLRPELADTTGDADSADRWINLAGLLASGDYKEACQLLLLQNARVMNARTGAPWVGVSDGTLQARFLDMHTTPLPDRAGLKNYWRNPYFLGSLRTVARYLEGHK